MSNLRERLKQILIGAGYDDESGLNKPAERVVRRMLHELREPSVDMMFSARSVELEELSFTRGADDKPIGKPRLTMDQAAAIWRVMVDRALSE